MRWVVAAMLMPGLALANNAKFKPCIDYFHVGPSECRPAPVEPSPTLPPAPLVLAPPTAPPMATRQLQQPQTLEQRIDDFMADHGKPPREYVAFHLEPSLENAMKWVHAYKRILERNFALVQAWTQAEELYDAAEAQGQDISVLGVGARTAIDDVPDFGIDVGLGQLVDAGITVPPGQRQPSRPQPFADPSLLGPDATVRMASVPNQQPPALPGYVPGLDLDEIYAQLAMQQANAGRVPAPDVPFQQPFQQPWQLPWPAEADDFATLQQAQAEQAQSDPMATPPADLIRQVSTAADQVADALPVAIRYYFSAECAYCQRFEPQFQNLIQRYRNKISVECVDMTPSGQFASNINGKVDCSWRPAQPGEVQQFGIKVTPSLIVNRGDGSALERINGYVDIGQLEAYLFRR